MSGFMLPGSKMLRVDIAHGLRAAVSRQLDMLKVSVDDGLSDERVGGLSATTFKQVRSGYGDGVVVSADRGYTVSQLDSLRLEGLRAEGWVWYSGFFADVTNAVCFVLEAGKPVGE
ncbi:MAG: hypothetical protein M1829_005360 [Trizodia sp. TS-e1964]|nr:MAG: hypothetical protein M1829_005360 [Trizodia sp. TS-e1964]